MPLLQSFSSDYNISASLRDSLIWNGREKTFLLFFPWIFFEYKLYYRLVYNRKKGFVMLLFAVVDTIVVVLLVL